MRKICYTMYDNRYFGSSDALDSEADGYCDYPVTEDNTTESAEENGIDSSYGVDSARNTPTNNVGGDFGSSDNGMNSESASETNLDALYESDETDAESADEFDAQDVAETDDAVFVDPSDETAATCDCDSDDCYCDSRSICGGTIRAQEKCRLDDYEIISDVLGSEKQLVKLYSTALCESAEEPLRDIIRENLNECAADQYSTFEYMQKRGMYNTEQADEEKILRVKQQFTPIVEN